MATNEEYKNSSEETKFSRILDDLLIMQTKVRINSDSEIIPSEYYETIDELNRLCTGKEITASGSQLLVPVKDEWGNLASVEVIDGSTSGIFKGLAIYEDDHDGVKLGIQICLEATSSSSPVHDSNLATYVFAPLDSSTFMFCIDFKDLLPDKNDQIAMDIDECLLNESIDFKNLATLFQQVIYNMGDLQKDMYTNYLNKVSTFDRITAIASVGLSINEYGISMYRDRDGGYCADGDFDSFVLVNCESEDGGNEPRLIVMLIDGDGNQMGVFVDDIQAIQLT